MHDQTTEYLRYLTYKGVEERYGVDVREVHPLARDSAQYLAERVEHELSTIETAGFPAYFCIVQDVLRFCREAGIATGPGRGSICGSVVAYATYITDVEPIRFGIPFERFLHLERVAQPDIDLDICANRRHEVIDYLRRTYGADSVAQIMTFTPMNAKGVVRDVCRVLHVDQILRGIRYNETGDKLAAMIPEGQGADQVKLTEYLLEPGAQEFKDEIERQVVPFEGEQLSVLGTCLALEGLRRHSSAHAAGVVIADRPLIDLVPLYRKNQQSEVQIQFDMWDAESVGLLKLDVLGLRTVSVLGEAEAIIRKHIPDFSIKTVPLDDEATFALLSAGDTSAVFQLEGAGITAATTGMQPDRFEDIIALIALYRPGPMEQLGSYFRRKHDEEEVTYAHPDLKPVLERSFGLFVYQEQVMGTVRVMGGYSAGEADMFRKAIGKKLVPLIRAEIDKFYGRAVANGYSEDCVSAICEQIFDFGRYGFNLGHATGYAFITYWTAYLKANFAAEFFTANLNSQIGVLDKISTLLRDAEKRGIPILPPDINESGRDFTLTDAGIRFGIGGVKGLGESAIQDILEERDSKEKNVYSSKRVDKVKSDNTPYKASVKVIERGPNRPGPFSDLPDFIARLPHITTTVKKALILSGAFGSGSEWRRRYYEVLDDMNVAIKKGKPFNIENVNVQMMPEQELMEKEREVMGFYVTQNPLQYYKDEIDEYGACYIGTYDALSNNVSIAGIVGNIRTHQTSRGEMAWVTLQNEMVGLPPITIFASLWAEHKVKLQQVVIVNGVKDHHPKFGHGIKASYLRILGGAAG